MSEESKGEFDIKPVGFYNALYVRSAIFTPDVSTLPAVKFTYRPLASNQMERVTRSLTQKPGEAQRVFVKLVCERVKSWDMTKPNGDTVEISGNEKEIGSCVDHRIIAGMADMILDSTGLEDDAQADF